MDNWRNLSVDTKLLWNQSIRIGHCATLIDYSSMLFVNTLYVDHLIVEFCICILKAMTNYQPKLFICLLSLTMLHGQILVSFEVSHIQKECKHQLQFTSSGSRG